MRASRSRWIVPLGRRTSVDLRWWLLAFAMAAVAVRLGIWQMDRAALKETMQQHYYDRLAMAAVPCATLAHALDPAFLRVRLEGRFVPGREYLWDNRTYQGRAGYEVLTPFACADGTRLLVDRGWIPTGDDRDRDQRWPTPDAPVILAGFVFVPAVGVQWLADAAWPSGWPKRIGRLDMTRIAQDQGEQSTAPPGRPVTVERLVERVVERVGEGVGDGMYRYPVIVDGAGSGTFVYNFEPASISPTRNRGYVVQWFALAVGIVGYLGYRSWQRN